MDSNAISKIIVLAYLICLYVIPTLVLIITPLYQISRKRKILGQLGNLIIPANLQKSKGKSLIPLSIFIILCGIGFYFMDEKIIGVLMVLCGSSFLFTPITLMVFSGTDGLYEEAIFLSQQRIGISETHSWFLDKNGICNLRTTDGIVHTLSYFSDNDVILNYLEKKMPDKKRND